MGFGFFVFAHHSNIPVFHYSFFLILRARCGVWSFPLDEIKIFFPSLFLPLPEGSRGPEKIPLFRPGEQVQARVLQQIDAQHFSLQLGGRTVVAESNVSLPLSADLVFRVEEAGPRTLLKWLPPEGLEDAPTISFLKRALAADIPLEQLAARLSQLEQVKWMVPAEKETWKQFLHLFHRFSLSDLESQGPPLLEKLFSQSGFFWESKVQRWIEGGGKNQPTLWSGKISKVWP